MVQFHKRFSNFDAADIFVKTSRLVLVERFFGLRQYHLMKILYYSLSRDGVSHKDNSRQNFMFKILYAPYFSKQNKNDRNKYL